MAHGGCQTLENNTSKPNKAKAQLHFLSHHHLHRPCSPLYRSPTFCLLIKLSACAHTNSDILAATHRQLIYVSLHSCWPGASFPGTRHICTITSTDRIWFDTQCHLSYRDMGFRTKECSNGSSQCCFPESERRNDNFVYRDSLIHRICLSSIPKLQDSLIHCMFIGCAVRVNFWPHEFSSGDNFYEIARYRFNGNGKSKLLLSRSCSQHPPGSEPTCITGVINWVHGTYELQPNGSIILTPLGDGYQQIQDPCAAVSNFIETLNITEIITSWRIFSDPTQGFKLHLFSFDGSPLNPQFQVSTTPNMLPTRLLRNVTTASTVQRRSNAALDTRITQCAALAVGMGLMGLGLLVL